MKICVGVEVHLHALQTLEVYLHALQTLEVQFHALQTLDVHLHSLQTLEGGGSNIHVSVSSRAKQQLTDTRPLCKVPFIIVQF